MCWIPLQLAYNNIWFDIAFSGLFNTGKLAKITLIKGSVILCILSYIYLTVEILDDSI